MKKGKVLKTVLILILVILVLIMGAYIAYDKLVLDRKTSEQKDVEKQVDSTVDVEREVSSSKANEIFEWLPLTYSEAKAPLTEEFMLGESLDRIRVEDKTKENIDYSETNVVRVVKNLFGENAKINKEHFIKTNKNYIDNKSDYYYIEDEYTYAQYGRGEEGNMQIQILKSITEKANNYYVYVYVIDGLLGNSDSNVNIEGLEDCDIVQFKGKNDKQIVIERTNIENIEQNYPDLKMFTVPSWIKQYENDLIVYKYTLNKAKAGYYLVSVEEVK